MNMYYVMHMTGGSQQIKFGETYAKFAKTECQARPTKPKYLVYKTGTSGFSKLSILTRKNTSCIIGIE
jgi:hypothetical protein